MMRSAGSLVDAVLGAVMTAMLFAMSWSAVGATTAAAERIVHRSLVLAEVSRLEVVVGERCGRIRWPDPRSDFGLVETADSVRMGHLDGIPARDFIVSWSEDGVRIGHSGAVDEFPRLRMVTVQTVNEPFPALRLVVSDGQATWPIIAPLAGAAHDGAFTASAAVR